MSRLLIPRKWEDIADDFVKATDAFIGASEALDAEAMTQAKRYIETLMNEMRQNVRIRSKKVH